MSTVTFQELEDVLSKPRLQRYFKRSGLSTHEFLANLERVVEFIQATPTNAIIRDEKALPLIELAATIPSPEYIITGDKDFEQENYSGVPVISASLFVQKILD